MVHFAVIFVIYARQEFRPLCGLGQRGGGLEGRVECLALFAHITLVVKF